MTHDNAKIDRLILNFGASEWETTRVQSLCQDAENAVNSWSPTGVGVKRYHSTDGYTHQWRCISVHSTICFRREHTLFFSIAKRSTGLVRARTVPHSLLSRSTVNININMIRPLKSHGSVNPKFSLNLNRCGACEIFQKVLSPMSDSERRCCFPHTSEVREHLKFCSQQLSDGLFQQR